MRDDIFDTYLRSILDNKTPKKEEGDASAPAAVAEPSESGDSGTSEKTIRLEGDAVISSLSEPTRPEPVAPAPPKRRKRRVRKANYSAYGGIVLSTLVICCSLLISLFVIVVGRDFFGIDTNSNTFTLYIQSNWNVSDIADYLSENGIIEYPELFRQFAKLRVGDGAVYPGDIEVKPSMSYSEILDGLTTQRQAHPTVTVTFIEGMTIDDCAKLLEENGVCDADEFIFAFNSNVYGFDFESEVGSSGLKYYKYEGYLFPDTYEFYASDPENDYTGDSVYNIVRKIKERTAEIINADFIKACKDSGRSLDEVVTMASLLQLESGSKEEMPKIASVFYNRLSHPDVYPRLQSDTTKRYINSVIKQGSTAAYQEMFDAYDTYVCQGLPVGPICNPGADALDAALHPAESPYYYFCSSEDGQFFYAETYAEHQENAKLAGLDV